LGNMVLNEPVDAVIRVDSLNPGDALELNNLIKTAGRRFVVIYDPSLVMAYYKAEAMLVVEQGNESYENTTLRELIESVKNTLKELMEVRNARVVIILPSELYEQVQRGKEEDVDLRQVLDNLKRDVVKVNLGDEGFLREIIKRYSGCDNVSGDLVRRVMNFDSYTLVAKYTGIWLREKKCKVEDVDKALRESAGKPKLFFAHYIWGTILGKSMDLAKKVSVPLILHATFGQIPKGITYIMKAVNEGGKWKLIDRNELAKVKLEDLREDELEPIAKWLYTLHEDLIEETLEELVGLGGDEARKHYIDHGFKDFIEALDWGYKEALGEGREILGQLFGEIAHGESSEETKAESNSLLNLGMNLPVLVFTRLMIALKPLTNCWKRAALIIGYALTGHPIMPRPEDLSVFHQLMNAQAKIPPEDLRKSVVESLGDALRECDVDYYLLVGNEIPPLIIALVIIGLAYTPALAWTFIDRYNEAIGEVNRILNIVRGRGISEAESLYGLGLASIIVKVVESGKPIEPGDADAVLDFALSTIQRVASPVLIMPILYALRSLRDKAPQRYIELLAAASGMENLDSGPVRYILSELSYVLSNYGNVVRGYAWSLVYAINAYANLLRKYFDHFNSEEVGDMASRVGDLLNELGRFKSSLGIIAWAVALATALEDEGVRGLMKEKLGIDVVSKASEVLEELNDMRNRVQELMGDKEFMGYVESKFVKADEEAVKKEILEASSPLKYALADYRLNENELDEAKELFNEVAKEYWEIGQYENYLTARGLALRVEAIKGSLVGKELVNEFRQLYEETFNEEHFELTARYLSTASHILGNYLVSLALINDVEGIRKLPEKHWLVLNADRRVSVLTRLMLNALLGPRRRLSGELKGKLSVNPEELIYAFEYDMLHNSLPALRVAFKMISPEVGIKLCEEFDDIVCTDLVLAVEGDSVVVKQLREAVINDFNNSLEGFDSDVRSLINKFRGLVRGLDGRSLVQLIAPGYSLARLALMLHALINGNKELAKALALDEAASVSKKLPTRLLLEAYKACCDLGKDEFRLALARLFFLHV